MLVVRADWKHAGKDPSRSQVTNGSPTVIDHRSAHLKATSQLLWMSAFHPGAEWKIGRTAQNQIEALVLTQHRWIAQVATTDVIAILQPIPSGRFAGKTNALRLGFHGNKPCMRQPPSGDHSNRTNTTAQIENRRRRWASLSAVPGRQHIIGRKPMTIDGLK